MVNLKYSKLKMHLILSPIKHKSLKQADQNSKSKKLFTLKCLLCVEHCTEETVQRPSGYTFAALKATPPLWGHPSQARLPLPCIRVYMYTYESADGELAMSPTGKLMAHVAWFRLHHLSLWNFL